MAIDKTQEYWHGENAEDAIEYLAEYSENEVTKAAIIKCRQCNADILTYKIDSFEGAIEVTCTFCKEARLLLDSGDYWEDSEPEEATCTQCNNNQFNIAVGFVYRPGGEVKWIYTADRCVNCGVLGSNGDWKINYSPTNEMEKNI